MAQRHKVDEVVRKLREAEVELNRGVPLAEVCRRLQVSEQTYYRWRQKYGGLQPGHAVRLKALEQENARLKRLVAEKELDIQILREAASGNF